MKAQTGAQLAIWVTVWDLEIDHHVTDMQEASDSNAYEGLPGGKLRPLVTVIPLFRCHIGAWDVVGKMLDGEPLLADVEELSLSAVEFLSKEARAARRAFRMAAMAEQVLASKGRTGASMPALASRVLGMGFFVAAAAITMVTVAARFRALGVEQGSVEVMAIMDEAMEGDMVVIRDMLVSGAAMLRCRDMLAEEEG